MSLLDLSAAQLLERFGSSDPTPGGGSAAALGGAVGAGLVAMVCTMTKTRTGAAEERTRLDAARDEAASAGTRLGTLVDEDTAAYDGVVAAYRLPKGTDEEKLARKAAIAAAMRRATDVPLETGRACLAVMNAAAVAIAEGNPNAVSDAQTGQALAWAGLQGAAYNVRANAPSLGEAGAADLRAITALVDGGASLRPAGW